MVVQRWLAKFGKYGDSADAILNRIMDQVEEGNKDE